MAIGYNPKVVTNGLVLCLDAANSKSYPGSGNAWYDLTNNKYHMLLINTPTFGSEGALKYFTLNGTDQYGTCNAAISGSVSANVSNLGVSGNTPKTVVCIANMTANVGSSSGGLFDLGDTGVSGQHYCLRVSSNTATTWRAQFWGTPDYDFNYNGANVWTMYSVVYGADKIGKTYGNAGVLLGQDGGAFDLVTAGARPFEMGRYNGSSYVGAKIAMYLIYNKELTVEEIQQNYNALRGRFEI
jgi:hypothetical protein